MRYAASRATSALALIAAFSAGYVAITNHFERGPFLQDSVLIAQVMVDGHLPKALGGGSFYAHHVSPILYGFGLPGPVAFAVLTGLSMAMLALAVIWMRPTVSGVVLGILFACNGIMMAILRFPHYEILIAAALILMLAALHKARYWLAAIFLGIALLTREDSGFHAALFLAAFYLMRRDRMALWFMAAAIVGSVTSLAIQHMMFPTESSFARVYMGDHFSHVTFGLIVERLAGWTLYRTYAIAPMIVCLLLALRRPAVAFGYIACLPWLAIHLVAVAALPGTLSGYYAFPLIVAMFWPLIAEKGNAGFSLMLAASFCIWYQQNPAKVGLIEMFTG